MTRDPAARATIVLALIGPVPGCSRMLGPERWDEAPIAGRITIDGEAIGPGWVELLPIEGSRGPLRSAPVGPDGRFAIGRANVGRNLVRVVLLPRGAADRRKASLLNACRGLDSPLRLEVPRSPGEEVQVDLSRSRPAGTFGAPDR